MSETQRKIRVIVTEFPPGYKGAEEFRLHDDGSKVKDQTGEPVTMIVDDVLKLERRPVKAKRGEAKEYWRARPGVETPIPDDFMPILRASGAKWRYADGSRLDPVDDVG